MLKQILWFHRCTTYYYYRWQVMVGSVIPDEVAMSLSTLCFFLNLLNLNFILSFFFNVPIILLQLNIIIVFAIMAVLLFVNYLYLLAGRKFESIKKEFENNTKSENKKRKIITTSYTLLSFILFFVLVFATSPPR